MLLRLRQTHNRRLCGLGEKQPVAAQSECVCANAARTYGHDHVPDIRPASIATSPAHAACSAHPPADRQAAPPSTATVTASAATVDAAAAINTPAFAVATPRSSSLTRASPRRPTRAGVVPVHQPLSMPSDLRTCLALERLLNKQRLKMVFPWQVSWSVDDMSGIPDEHQTASCGQFYANLCAFDSETITQLVDLPPSSPPPPMPPFADLVKIAPTAVMASGGFDFYTLASASDSLTACTDNDAETPCIPEDRDHPVRRYTHTRAHSRSCTPLLMIVVSCVRSGSCSILEDSLSIRKAFTRCASI